MMPLYMVQLNGKLNTKINKKGLEAMVDHPLAKEHLNNLHTIMSKTIPENWQPGNNEVFFSSRKLAQAIMVEEEENGEMFEMPDTLEKFEAIWYKYAKKFDGMTEEDAYGPWSEGT